MRLNNIWEGCGRKGIWHKNSWVEVMEVDILATWMNWIVSVDAFINLTYSEQNQKHGRITNIAWRA